MPVKRKIRAMIALFQVLVAESKRRNIRRLFEQSGKISINIVAQRVYNLFYIHSRMGKESFGFEYDIISYPIPGSESCCLFYDFIQIGF